MPISSALAEIDIHYKQQPEYPLTNGKGQRKPGKWIQAGVRRSERERDARAHIDHEASPHRAVTNRKSVRDGRSFDLSRFQE